MNKKKHLIVGAGVTGCTIAACLAHRGHQVHVIDRADKIGGLCADTKETQTFGPHIFHTSDERVYRFISEYTTIDGWKNRVLASTSYGLLNFPVNLQTLSIVYGKRLTANQAIKEMESDREASATPMENAESYLYTSIGRKLTDTFFRAYSERQWKMPLNKIPSSVVQRIPSPRLNLEDGYFNDKYQGLPDRGFTDLFNRMLDDPNIKVSLNTPYEQSMNDDYDVVWYTGPIDQYHNFKHGALPYNSVYWTREYIVNDSQGNAVINNCLNNPHDDVTRSIEYPLLGKNVYHQEKPFIIHEHSVGPKHFNDRDGKFTLAYPIATEENQNLYKKYKDEPTDPKVRFVGRLANYAYYNMDVAIKKALEAVDDVLGVWDDKALYEQEEW